MTCGNGCDAQTTAGSKKRGEPTNEKFCRSCMISLMGQEVNGSGIGRSVDVGPVVEHGQLLFFELLNTVLLVGLIIARIFGIVALVVEKGLEKWVACKEYKRATWTKKKGERAEEESPKTTIVYTPGTTETTPATTISQTSVPHLRVQEPASSVSKQDQRSTVMADLNIPQSRNMLLSAGLTICMPMPLPGSIGMPLFEGANATEFLDHFNDLCKEYLVLDEDKLVKLPQYCSRSIGDAVKSLKEWKDKDYPALWKAILKEYKEHDSYQQIYSLQFLEKYKSVAHTKKDDILHQSPYQ